jgi:tRNA-specific 2-thiouridylase
MSERWLVAMSGGVDSSVAAALMLARGVEVVGVTMDLGEGALAGTVEGQATSKRCCGLRDADDAKAVARTLGIRHYVANYREAFLQEVVDPFVDEYLAGRTPIPCIACNRVLKFDRLVERARALGARGVATGHYARIAPGPDGEPSLFRPRDREKDQTYFLFDLPRTALAEVAFPLGDREKREVRQLAAALGLATAEKPESQGICFVPDGDVRAAIGRLRPTAVPPSGEIVDSEGNVLGRHDGALGFTLGQRKGLGLGAGPWYVSEVRPTERRLSVAREAALWRRSVEVRGAVWHEGTPPSEPVRVQIRHRHRSVTGRVCALADGRFRVECEEPVWAPAPGQAAVVYTQDDERLLGGGWIVASE